MLGIRLADGLPVAALPGGAAVAEGWVAAGLAQWRSADRSRFRLTRQGRLIADRLALSAL